MITKLNINSIQIGMIFIENLNKELYSRRIESLTNLNIRTIVEELKNLINLNILDYKEIGKTKVYFLKKTIESEIFLKLVENNRTFLFILNNKLLKLNLQELNGEVNFLIFGSYSRNKNDEKSDLDLLVFSKKKHKIKKIIIKFNLKVQVQWIDSFEDFKKEINKKNPLSLEILKNHILFGFEKEMIKLILNK